MASSDEQDLLYPPAKTPRGWHVLYHGYYKSPSVFNLHEKGMFTKRPVIASDLGARLLVSDELKIAIQYMRLVDSTSIDEVTGDKYFFMNKNGLVYLTDDLELEINELEKGDIDKEISDEVIRVYDEWFSSISNGSKDREIFASEFRKSLNPVIEKGRRVSQDWLIRNNNPWIEPFLPRMIHEFRNGIYKRVDHVLYEFYKEAGGGDTEEDLIKKINLFMRIYQSEGLIKPDGALWISEDEIWDCWTAFVGSEIEATRICRTMEEVLLPLKEDLKKEINASD